VVVSLDWAPEMSARMLKMETEISLSETDSLSDQRSPQA